MLRFGLKSFIILLITGLIFCATLPILAGEIDEKKYSVDDFRRIIDTLPDNKAVIWSGQLPEIADKIIIKKIVIDLSEQKMYLYENKIIAGEFLVSTGRPGMETPVGEYQIWNKFDRAWSRAAGLWMPYWMAVAPDGRFGIHELPEWPNGVKEGEDHLGQPVSHGCIRLGVGAAADVYNWAEVGTGVEIKK